MEERTSGSYRLIMSWRYPIKIRPADRLMSDFVKLRDKGLCQYNFKCFRGTPGTDCSHFQKRRHESIRFDPENLDLACRSCHSFVENHPEGQKTLEKWKLKQLGERRYNLLMIRKETYHKKDDVMTIKYIKILISELKV